MKGKNKNEAAKATAMIPLPVHSAAVEKLNKLGGRKSNFSFQWLIETLIGEWVAGERKIQSAPPKPREFQDDLERLQRVLDGGTPSQKRILRDLLKDYTGSLDSAPKTEVTPPNPSRSSRTTRDQPQPRR